MRTGKVRGRLLRIGLYITLTLLCFQNCQDLEPIRPSLEGGDSALGSLGGMSCQFKDQTILDGESIAAFSSPISPPGGTCDSVSISRKCQNGILTGDSAYENTQCQAALNCNFNGNIVNHGLSVQAYSAGTVPYGGSCAALAQTRTCTNGLLSGSFQFGNCSVQGASGCSFNGMQLSHGQSVTAYSRPTIVYGAGNCQAVSESRVCSNGVLSGSFTNLNCQITPQISGINLWGKNLFYGGRGSITHICGNINYMGQMTGNDKLEFRTDASGTRVFGVNIPIGSSGTDVGNWQCGNYQVVTKELCLIPPGADRCTYTTDGIGGPYLVIKSGNSVAIGNEIYGYGDGPPILWSGALDF